MNALSWLNSGVVWVEATPRSMQVMRGGKVRTWALDRAGGGGLTPACRAGLVQELTAFLERKPWQPRTEARCLLSAGGVTLRRWKIPCSGEEQTRRVLSLQIESELPLSPDELAWGWTKVGELGVLQDVLVAAVRKTSVVEILGVLEECGLAPRLTLAALARAGCVVPRHPVEPAEAWLDVGHDISEWLSMDTAGPTRLRVLPWSEQSLVREWCLTPGITPDMAEGWLQRVLGGSGGLEDAAKPGWDAAIRALAGSLSGLPRGGRLRLTGRLAGARLFRESLAGHLGSGVVVESGEHRGDRAVSDGLRRLQDDTKAGAVSDGLWLATAVQEAPTVLNQATPRKWALVAGLLLLGVLLMPYIEAMIFLPGLESKVAAVKARQDRLQTIDRQADFLRHLRSNQAPYMETLLVLGKTLPPGSKLESLNLNRKGEMALRVSTRQPQQAAEFRTQLTDSGFFSSVVIEEQSPTPDRQKVQIRISGQIKPANQRQGLAFLADPPSTNAPPGSAKPEGIPGRPKRGGPPPAGAPGPVPRT